MWVVVWAGLAMGGGHVGSEKEVWTGGSAAEPANRGEGACGCVVKYLAVDANAVLVEFIKEWLLVGRGGLFKAVVVEWALDDLAIGGNGGVGGWCGVECLWGGDGW